MNKVTEKSPDPLSRLLSSTALAWLVILGGIVLRLRRFLLDRGLMHDEALLAANVLSKSFGQLLKPLDLGDQAAPVGFLLLQKLSTLCFGRGEYAIRLVPFLAAVAALPLGYFLVRDLLGKPAALLAVAWLALAEPLIHYAAEGKQYSTDVFWTLLILLIGSKPLTRQRAMALGILGAIAVWFSHPIVFVLAGMGSAIFLENLTAEKRGNAAAIVVAGLAWLASFAINFFAITRHYAASDYLTRYWSAAFAPIRFHGATDFLWYPRALAEAMRYPLGLAPGAGVKSSIAVVAAVAFLAGCFALARRNRSSFLTVAVALLLCLAASGLRKYPFGERLLLFATPLFILPLAALFVGSWNAPIRLGFIALLFVYPLYIAAKYFAQPALSYSYDIKPAILYVRDHYKPGDIVYLHYGSDKLGHFYFDIDRDAPKGLETISGPFEPKNSAREQTFAADVAKLHGRIWFIFSMDPGDDRAIYQAILSRDGTKVDAREYKGGAAELYDLK